MTDNELKQRKTNKTKDKSNDIKDTKDKSNDDTKTKNVNKPFNANDAKKLAEEHRKELGKKMFKRSLKRMGYIVLACVVLYVYQWMKADQENFKPFVTSKDEIENVPLIKQVRCSDDYDEDRKRFPMCAPKVCGRLVIDNLIDERESAILLSLFKKALLLNSQSVNGSAYILDLHSGAMTYDTKFANVYALIRKQNKNDYFTRAEFEIYKQVKNKIHKFIAEKFQILPQNLHLTSPTFFSKLTGDEPKTLHDEYWHLHIDKKTYKSFHYTSLLYLNTYYDEFSGGRFVFADKEANSTVEPKRSRVLAFTSGEENPHFVERVEKGTRYAITISFTCDSMLAISDPVPL